MSNEIFLGRDWYLDQLGRQLDRFLDRRSPPSLPQVSLISGQGGIGKSTLMRELHSLAGRYHGSLQLLSLDWQNEKQGNPGAFSVPPDQVDGRIIFQALDRAAEDRLERWEKHRKVYRQIQSEADATLTAAIQASAEQSLSQKASMAVEIVAETAATAATLPAGPFGGLAQPVLARLARYGLRASPDLWAFIQRKLNKTQWDLLLAPELALAAGFARALAEASEDLPILVTLDTYELMDEWDGIVRHLIREAGPRLAWVIAGRHNLYETRFQPGKGRLNGYREEDRHHYEVVVLDLKALSREDIREFFRRRAPERPLLSDEETVRVDEATGAIPLALKLAADIWRDTGDLSEILSPENAPADRIVQEMVKRYTQYCIYDERDRKVLVALALVDGDAGLLKAMLQPEFGSSDEAFQQHLELVRHRYEAVQQVERKLRLHDEPALFFRQRYQTDEGRSTEWVQHFNQRAIDELVRRVTQLLDYHLSLRDLCEDPDYVRAAVQMAHFLLWLDPPAAAPWVIARYVEGLAFSGTLQQEILGTIQAWRPHLDARWLRRLAVLEEISRFPNRSTALDNLRRLLEEDTRRGWLKDQKIPNRYEKERDAVRLWFSSQAFLSGGMLSESLANLKIAFENTDSELNPRIAGTAQQLVYGFYLKKDYDHALQAVEIAVKADPANGASWRDLGTLHSLRKRYDKAEEYHRKALELDPNDANSWRELGTDYSLRKQYDKAEEYHRKALELDPNDANSWRQLGNDYSWRKQYDKAEEYHRKALELNPDDSWQELGWTLTYTKRFKEAESAFRNALEIDGNNALAWDGIGYIYLIRGSLQEARQALENSISADPTRPNPYALISCLLYRTRKEKEALEWAEKALERSHTRPSPELLLLGLQRAQALPVRSAVVEAAKKKVDDDSDKLPQAEWWALEGDFDEALAILAEAIRQTPDIGVWARFRPAFHPLLNDPRFLALTEEAEGSTWSDFGSHG